MPCGELDDVNYSKVQDVASTVVASSVGGTPIAKHEGMFALLTASLPLIANIVGAILGSTFRCLKKLLK